MSLDDLHDDDAMLARLARVAATVDPVPEAVVEAARGSYAWRTADDELAELVYDSALDDVHLVGLRSAVPTRQLTFEGPELAVELELRTDPPRLVGQLVPPQTAIVELRHGGGTVMAEADDLGRFVLEPLSTGPVSLRCSPRHGGRATSTAWLSI